MPAFRRIAILFGSLSLVFLLFHSSCKKVPETVPPPKEEGSLAPFTTPLPGSRLLGLTLNGQDSDTLSKLSGDPALLEASDLNQGFSLNNPAYTQAVFKLIMAQLDSGKPLKGIYAYFGILPKKYASHCSQEAGPDTCYIEPTAFECAGALQQKNWTDENYARICQSIGRLKILNPRYLIAVFDGDNTLWYQDAGDAAVRRGVESGKITWGDNKADLTLAYPGTPQRKDYKLKNNPFQYYKEIREKIGDLHHYQYAVQVFRGMTLNDALSVMNDALGQNYRPNPYPEMVELLQYLKAQGVVTGVISASPSFVIYPLAETLQYGIPLENSVGIDVLLQDPTHPENKPLRLSRLVLQGKNNLGDRFGNYQDVLSQYGSWTIVDAVPLLSAQAGKGMQARAIARRYVALYNRDPANAKDPLDLDDMRLLMFAGDNFAPQTDIPLSEPERPTSAQEMGNDQGLSEGLPFLEKSLGGTDILYIQRFLIDGGKVYGKTGLLGRFKAYLEQQNLLRSPRIGQVLIQPALTDLKPEGNSGGFLKEMPQVPESQPMAESLPHLVATPAPETKPTMTPPPAPKPFGPLPAEGPATPDTGPSQALPPDLPKPIPPAPPKLEPLPPGMGSKSDAL